MGPESSPNVAVISCKTCSSSTHSTLMPHHYTQTGQNCPAWLGPTSGLGSAEISAPFSALETSLVPVQTGMRGLAHLAAAENSDTQLAHGAQLQAWESRGLASGSRAWLLPWLSFITCTGTEGLFLMQQIIKEKGGERGRKVL